MIKDESEVRTAVKIMAVIENRLGVNTKNALKNASE